MPSYNMLHVVRWGEFLDVVGHVLIWVGNYFLPTFNRSERFDELNVSLLEILILTS